MNAIDLTATNHEIAEKLVDQVFASADPKAVATNLIHSIVDHPWLDAEIREHLVRAAAVSVELTVEDDSAA